MKGKRKKPNFYFSFKIISHLFRGFRGYTGVQGGGRRKEAKARWGGVLGYHCKFAIKK